jgi:DNA topoisomerase-1
MERIGNYRVEPPGIFRGRGEHPKSGMLKHRLRPEDVTLNIGKRNAVPICPKPGHAWGGIVHNDLVTWLAVYKNVDFDSTSVKYLHLSATSKFKGQSDL